MRTTHGALVDLLDRVLDRGAYLRADVVITVAGVPLLGLSLRALLGAVDTMVEYGVWSGTDPLVQADVDPPAAAVAAGPGAAGANAAETAVAGAATTQR